MTHDEAISIARNVVALSRNWDASYSEMSEATAEVLDKAEPLPIEHVMNALVFVMLNTKYVEDLGPGRSGEILIAFCRTWSEYTDFTSAEIADGATVAGID